MAGDGEALVVDSDVVVIRHAMLRREPGRPLRRGFISSMGLHRSTRPLQIDRSISGLVGGNGPYRVCGVCGMDPSNAHRFVSCVFLETGNIFHINFW